MLNKGLQDTGTLPNDMQSGCISAAESLQDLAEYRALCRTACKVAAKQLQQLQLSHCKATLQQP
jgi:hypothetical protein